MLILVYFEGRRPTPSHWSIFMGDLPTLHLGLFSGATYPHMFIVVHFQGRPAHTLTLIYFQGRPAHTLT